MELRGVLVCKCGNKMFPMLNKLDQEVAYAQRELETANDWYAEIKKRLEKG